MSSIQSMEPIVALAKHRGFIFPGSEIYGGLANTWDYGPLGVELKNNIKRAWWKKFIQQSPYNVGLDAAILMNPRAWIASGHVGNFNDPMIDCRTCKATTKQGRSASVTAATTKSARRTASPTISNPRPTVK